MRKQGTESASSADRDHDRVNDITALNIGLAGPDDIRGWSSGEVKNVTGHMRRQYTD